MEQYGKKMMKAAGIAAAGAAAAGATVYATAKLWVKMAMDREEPRLMKKLGGGISGVVPDEAFEAERILAAKILAGTEHEEVHITGDDGVGLVGHFFPCASPKRIIIAFHGWRSSWSNDFGMISGFWHKENCSVLYVEQRGQNNSGGDYISFGLAERYDCIAWVNWIMCRCGSRLPIYLAGLSMGATTVLMAADLPLPETVHGIMADCGFTSPRNIWDHVGQRNIPFAYGIYSALAGHICKRRTHLDPGEHSTIDALQKTKLPVLFVHGTDDHFVPVSMTFENYKACASPKRLLVVPGADHAMSYYVDRAAYEEAVLDFWEAFDVKDDTGGSE